MSSFASQSSDYFTHEYQEETESYYEGQSNYSQSEKYSESYQNDNNLQNEDFSYSEGQLDPTFGTDFRETTMISNQSDQSYYLNQQLYGGQETKQAQMPSYYQTEQKTYKNSGSVSFSSKNTSNKPPKTQQSQQKSVLQEWWNVSIDPNSYLQQEPYNRSVQQKIETEGHRSFDNSFNNFKLKSSHASSSHVPLPRLSSSQASQSSSKFSQSFTQKKPKGSSHLISQQRPTQLASQQPLQASIQQQIQKPIQSFSQPFVQQNEEQIAYRKQVAQRSLINKVNEVNKARKNSRNPSVSMCPVEFTQGTMKQLTKALLLLKKLTPNCSLDRTITNMYYALVLRQPPPIEGQELNALLSINGNDQASKALPAAPVPPKIPLVQKYNIVIEYFCKVGYSYDNSRQHFVDQGIPVSRDEYKAILLDIMEKVLRKLVDYLLKQLPSYSQPILTQEQEKLAKLQLVKAFKWMPNQERLILEYLIKHTYKLDTQKLSMTPQGARKFYEILLQQIQKASIIKNVQNIPVSPPKLSPQPQQDNFTIKTESQPQQPVPKLYYEYPTQIFTDNNNPQNQPKTPAKEIEEDSYQSLQKPRRPKKDHLQINLQEEEEIFSDQNLQEIIKFFIKTKRPNLARDEFIQYHPCYANKISWQMVKNRLEKVSRIAFRLLNEKYGQTFCQLSQKPDYKILLSQRPLPKISDEKFKIVLRSAKHIESRIKLLEFYMDEEDIDKQFEAIKSIREALGLTPQIQAEIEKRYATKNKKRDSKELKELFDNDGGDFDDDMDVYDSDGEQNGKERSI